MAKQDELEEEKKPRWVNPKQNQAPVQQPKPRWQNPKYTSEREWMDRRLERAGLLKYQTKGLSADEISRRYANAGITVSGNSSWFKDNYGFDAPEGITTQVKNQPYTPNVFPTVEIKPPTATPQFSRLGGGLTNDKGQTTQFKPTTGDYVTLQNGLTVRAPKPAVSDSPYASTVFATVEQARKGEANWTDISATERKQKLSNPNFYKSGEITQYPTWMQQQILADPDFKWDQLPAWQRTYFELSSSPAGMGAAQGALMGATGGIWGGAIGAALGGTMGWAAGKSGYDATKEFWEQDGLVAGGFGLLNWLAEQTEKAAGVVAQGAAILTGNDPNFDPTKRNLDIEFNKDFNLIPGKDFDPELLSGSSWEAGAMTFEILGPALDEALKTNDPINALLKVLTDPEKYIGEEIYLGADAPVKLNQTWVERMHEARDRIKKGEDYRQVMMDFQTGIKAQLFDMAGQAAADPLNFLPNQTTKVLGTIADLDGNKVAAQALNQSSGLMEAGRKYQTLVQTGQALTIDPNFKLDQMGKFSRWVAGINEQGQVKAGSLLGTTKGLLDPIKNKVGWLEDMATQTPHSRAQTGANLFYENVSAMLQMFDDPAQAGKYLKALSNNDMTTWSELGSRFAESPEFYTVLPALKDFNTNLLDGIIQAWDMTGTNRDLLTRVADIMGEQPGNLLEDLAARGTAEQDFQRMVTRLRESQSPQAKALLAEVEAGTFTAETLKQMVDVFSGDGALPWHPGQWKAQMLDAMGSHFDEWVTKRLMLDQTPEAKSAFFRTSALMKQAQSILLLGGSPGYAITNGLSNMVHRAVSGMFGYMTGKQIDTFMERMGVTPARFDEGVGIGGQVEQAAGTSRVKTEAMDKAVKGKGALTRAKDVLGKLSKGMPFSKLSAVFERMEGRQAFSIAMRDAWSQSWRRGVGFREMPTELANAIRQMGQDPNRIYAAIEAGMNIAEVEAAVYGRQAEVQARSLIHDAAQKKGLGASEAAMMLERTGVLDTLDSFLKGAQTREQKAAAFRRAKDVAQEWMDMRTGDDLAAIAENVKQRVGLEGAAAALDVVQKAHGTFFDAWMDHYYRFGEVMNDLQSLPEAEMNKAIDLAYAQSDREFRRIDARTAANYKGIFEAWGLSGNPNALRVLESVKAAGDAMGNSYRAVRELRKQWRERWANDPTNPARWDELEAIRTQSNAIFRDAFKAKHDAEVQMGKALGDVYEGMYGPAAGEAARKWYEDVTKMNQIIETRERDFRAEMEQARRSGTPKEFIDNAKQKYYSETKILLIAEAEKINVEGIARLERVIKGGGGQSPVSGVPVAPVDGGPSNVAGQKSPVEPTVSDLTSPSPEGAGDEVNALMAAAEQRKATEAREKAEKVSAVWDVAEEYWAKGGNYSRAYIGGGGDRYALIGALRKVEYGGIPDLFDLNDSRLTPELTREILERRKAIKEAAGNVAAEKVISGQATVKGGRKFDSTQITDDTTILRAIALHGGLDMNLRLDITGEKNPKGVPGMFTKKGMGIDEMARMLADDGYPIDVNHPDDTGGVRQTTELINRQRTGNPVYPVGHNYDADIAAAEAAYLREVDGLFEETPFDAALWQSEFVDVATRGDLSRLYEMIGDFPEDLLPTPIDEGGTWRDYLSRTADEVGARVEEEARMERVAEGAAQAEETIALAEHHADAMTARTQLMEQMAEAFKLDEKETRAYGELSDAMAGWYARATGESVDDFYNRYFGQVENRYKSFDDVQTDGLLQEAERNLVAVHNLSAAKLLHAAELGGIAMPSLAILRKDLAFDGFGDITLIARDRLIDPGDRTNVVGNADLYTPRYPSFNYELGKQADAWVDDAISTFKRVYGEEAKAKFGKSPSRWTILDNIKTDGRQYAETDPVVLTKFLDERGHQVPETPKDLYTYVRDNFPLEFDEYLDDTLNSISVKKKFFKGFTPSGYRKYADYTLDNIVKQMKSEMKEGESFTYGAGTVRSKAAKKFTSIEAIRKNEGKLISAEQMEVVKTEFNDRLTSLASENEKHYKIKDRGFGYLDTFASALAEGIQNKRLEQTFSEYQFNTDNMDFDAIREYVQDLRDAPSEYFEAKIKRAVGLDEFSAAVIPVGTSQRVRDILAKMGIEAVEYDPKVDGSRREVVARTAAERNLLFQQEQQGGGDVTFNVEPTGFPDGSYRIRGSDGNLYNLKKGKMELKPEGEGSRRFKSFEDAQAALEKAGYQAAPSGAGENPTPSPSPKVEGSKKPATIDKGMVTFDGMKGTIYAFEAGDFSTVVHESAHIYRKVLKDVANRTGDPYIRRDLQTIEAWAGVKDGKWDVAAEEKFARGFERYVAEGKAPTVALKAAFENFKQWMLDIYRSITGSQIDVTLTDEVRRVFDRMLGAENLRVDLDNMLLQMNYDPKKYYVDPLGHIVQRPTLHIEVDKNKVDLDVAAMDIEGMRTRAEAMRERMKRGEVEVNRESVPVQRVADPLGGRGGYMGTRYENSLAITSEQVRALTEWTREKMVEGGRSNPNILFQNADVPFGEYERASQFRAESEGLEEGWREKVMPLLEAMEEVSQEQWGVGGGQLNAEGQAMLKKYMRQVQNDMATAKLTTMRFAEKQRDFALLNYSKRYGFDRMADFVMPYQFYTSRSLFTWAARAIDKPALYANYARLRMQQDRYERDIPERLRGKIRIAAPWMPDWMGDAMYIDPLRNLFFPATIINHFERRQQEKDYQVIEAERVLQEWQAAGQYSDAELIEAAKSRSGTVWERAWAEAQMRRESENANPVDFFTSFFGPAWYLSTPLNLAGIEVPGISKGDPNKVNTLPLGNTARALETVTKGTWAEPVGQLFGLIGKAEDWGRGQFKLPTRGEYAEYYTKRQVANMVAEGLISPEDAQLAMIEKQGEIWEKAKERVDMELAMRVPLAGVTYAALHGGVKAGAQAALPSLFGAGLLPAGELEYRGLKQEWNEAWKLADAGDTQAVSRFFDNYPEYEAYLAKGKDDGELLRSFLIGQIWDSYMELGDTNQKLARAELGEEFQQAFLNKETRSYDTLDVNTLTEWARLLGARTPIPDNPTPNPTPSLQDGEGGMRLYPEDVTGVTDQFFEQRREKFPNYYAEQQGYYNLPKSERRDYLLKHPNLKAYWSWKDSWYKAYPEYVPIFNGEAFKRVDTSGWMPGLEDLVRESAYTGGRLPSGAYKALMNVWLMEGQPMEDFDAWVEDVVLPGMLVSP